MTQDLRIALVQMAIADGAPAANLARATQLIRGADQADLYLLPELFTTGYAHDQWPTSADRDTPVIAAALQRLATERAAVIAGSMIARAPNGLVNRFWLFRPGNVEPVVYDKGHLFAPMAEDRHLVAGERRVRTPIAGWCAALSLCFDLRFPEMYRMDAVQGADLFLVAAEWPAERAPALRALAVARAIENQAYLALVNRVGTAATDGTAFGGGSALIGPDGSVLADATDTERVVIAVARHANAVEARQRLAVLPLRRAGLDF